MSETNQTRSHEQSLYEATLHLKTPEERQAFLNAACARNPELRRRIEELLAAASEAEAFFDRDAMKQAGLEGQRLLQTVPEAPITENPGERIGRYRLLQKIGEGGCGVVYMAEQEEPVRRRVALKVIKLGMDTKSVIARFEAERQALALMDHPNIAKVHDAGATESGRPYFVMELVRGVKITEYCDEKKLSTRERLDLFIKVCGAVQHAHQKGIIHRDLKPSNILVSVNDGVAVPKVIDFGIAKATSDQRLTDKTVFTAFEQFIGTPAYMSPEQAEITSVDVDTRSDIYSLGVLLYELLTGQTPFDAKELLKIGLDEMRRTIREKEPDRPSTRVSTLDGQELTTTAKRRGLEAPKLVNLLRGDLDWIVMKCLEKDRARRYETANGLAMDIQRHLSNEPVVACPPSPTYRLQKMVRRNRFAFAAGAGVAGALVLGLCVATWALVRERAARQQAVAAERKATGESRKSREVSRLLQDLLEGVGPEVAKGRDATIVKEILDTFSQRINKELTNEEEIEAELRSTAGRVYFALAEYPAAEAMDRRVVEIERKLHPTGSRDLLAALENLAMTLEERGSLGEAEALFREELAIAGRVLGPKDRDLASCLDHLGHVLWKSRTPGEAEEVQRRAVAMMREVYPDGSPELAAALAHLASTLGARGAHVEAEALQREAVAMAEKLPESGDLQLAEMLNGLAVLLWGSGKSLEEAETVQRQALEIERKLLPSTHPNIASSLHNLATILEDRGQPEKVEQLYREALELDRKEFGVKHPNIANTLSGLSHTLAEEGKLPEAEATAREALAMWQELLGPEHANVASSMQNLSLVLTRENKWTEAEALARKASAMLKELLGPESAPGAESLNVLGMALKGQGKLPEAEATFRESLGIYRKALGANHPATSVVLANLADLLCDEGKLAEAETHLKEAVETEQRLLGQEHPKVAGMLGKLATLKWRRGNYAEAEALSRQALAFDKRAFGTDHPTVARDLNSLALMLDAQNRLPESEAAEREALGIFRSLLGPAHAEVAIALCNLALTLSKEGKREEAAELARESLEIRRKALGSDSLGVAVSLNVLANILLGQRKLTEAEEAARQALALMRKTLGDANPSVAPDVGTLGSILAREGRFNDAETLYDEFLSPATGSQTNSALLFERRAELRAQRGQWTKAATDLGRAITLKPTGHGPWHCLAAVLVQEGDIAGYREHCRNSLEVFSAATDPYASHCISKDCLILPFAVSNLTLVGQMADLALKAISNSPNAYAFEVGKALADYRRGQFGSAAAWAQRGVAEAGTNWTFSVEGEMVLAMAQHQMNQVEPARLTLAKGLETADSKLPKIESGNLGPGWLDWIIAQALLREARGLIEGQTTNEVVKSPRSEVQSPEQLSKDTGAATDNHQPKSE